MAKKKSRKTPVKSTRKKYTKSKTRPKKSSKKIDIKHSLYMLTNPYEEDERIVSLKDDGIEIRGPEHISESGSSYHVSVTVPNTEFWKKELSRSLGISYRWTKPDIKILNNKIEFGVPVDISVASSWVIESLKDEGINVEKIPEKEWESLAESKEFKAAELESARLIIVPYMELFLMKMKSEMKRKRSRSISRS